MEHRSRSYVLWGMISLAFLCVCMLVVNFGTGVSGSSPSLIKAIPFEVFEQRSFLLIERFLTSFPRILLKYVLIPVLCESVFTIPLSILFYREFVRIAAERPIEMPDARPNRYRLLVVCGIVVTAIMLLFLADILRLIYSHRPLTVHPKLPVTQARMMGFMFLAVMNPLVYQVIVGLRFALRMRRFRFQRFRAIMITIMLVAPVSYSLILTVCYALFEHTNWKYATVLKLYDLHPPELSLWMTGLIGMMLMWLSIGSSKKFMIDRSAGPVPSN